MLVGEVLGTVSGHQEGTIASRGASDDRIQEDAAISGSILGKRKPGLPRVGQDEMSDSSKRYRTSSASSYCSDVSTTSKPRWGNLATGLPASGDMDNSQTGAQPPLEQNTQDKSTKEAENGTEKLKSRSAMETELSKLHSSTREKIHHSEGIAESDAPLSVITDEDGDSSRVRADSPLSSSTKESIVSPDTPCTTFFVEKGSCEMTPSDATRNAFETTSVSVCMGMLAGMVVKTIRTPSSRRSDVPSRDCKEASSTGILDLTPADAGNEGTAMGPIVVDDALYSLTSLSCHEDDQGLMGPETVAVQALESLDRAVTPAKPSSLSRGTSSQKQTDGPNRRRNGRRLSRFSRRDLAVALFSHLSHDKTGFTSDPNLFHSVLAEICKAEGWAMCAVGDEQEIDFNAISKETLVRVCERVGVRMKLGRRPYFGFKAKHEQSASSSPSNTHNTKNNKPHQSSNEKVVSAYADANPLNSTSQTVRPDASKLKSDLLGNTNDKTQAMKKGIEVTTTLAENTSRVSTNRNNNIINTINVDLGDIDEEADEDDDSSENMSTDSSVASSASDVDGTKLPIDMEEKEDFYCVCGSQFTHDYMIECQGGQKGRCRGWVHPACLGLDHKSMSKEELEKFTCTLCVFDAKGMHIDLVARVDEEERNKDASCSFCGERSENDPLLGDFVGPFVTPDGAKHWIHNLCAAASTNVGLTKDGLWYNVSAAISRTKKFKCRVCKRRGANVQSLRKGAVTPNYAHIKCVFKQGKNRTVREIQQKLERLPPLPSDPTKLAAAAEKRTDLQIQLVTEMRQSLICESTAQSPAFGPQA